MATETKNNGLNLLFNQKLLHRIFRNSTFELNFKCERLMQWILKANVSFKLNFKWKRLAYLNYIELHLN